MAVFQTTKEFRLERMEPADVSRKIMLVADAQESHLLANMVDAVNVTKRQQVCQTKLHTSRIWEAGS